MRDPDTFQVVRPFSLREIEDAERQYQEKIDDFSLFDAVSGAFREQNTLATVFNNTVGYEPDETFELENYFLYTKIFRQKKLTHKNLWVNPATALRFTCGDCIL